VVIRSGFGRSPAREHGDVGGAIYRGDMDIRNCPECGEDTMSAGLARWPGVDGPVDVTRCASDECDWAAVDEDLEVTHSVSHAIAA
jgi:hypothetical protein